MKQMRLSLCFVALTILVAAGNVSCGFKRKLVSITIIPNNATLGGPGLSIQYKAVGNYVHPPDGRDLTDSVTWESSAPQVISIDSKGLGTSGLACGTDITITASSFSDPDSNSGSLVIGIATVNVTCPGGQ